MCHGILTKLGGFCGSNWETHTPLQVPTSLQGESATKSAKIFPLDRRTPSWKRIWHVIPVGGHDTVAARSAERSERLNVKHSRVEVTEFQDIGEESLPTGETQS